MDRPFFLYLASIAGLLILIIYSGLSEAPHPVVDLGDVPENLDDMSTSVFRGVFGSATFPVERFGPAPEPGDTRKYFDLDVLVLKFLDAENESREYYLHHGGRTEMILADQGGNGVAGGLTFDEINDAYKLGLPVEVEGPLFELQREGQTYPVLHAKRIKVKDREKAPLVAYHSRYITGRYTPEICYGFDRTSLPQEFLVGRNVTGVIWDDVKQIFEIILNPGDRMRITFNSSDPVFFGLYAPNSTMPLKPAMRWGVPMLERNETNQLDLVMDVFERGTYIFLFDARPNVWAEVKFNCQKIPAKTMDLLFMEKGSHSGAMGGISSMPFYPQPLPSNRVIGRTWSKSGAWADHSYSYETELYEGDLIRVQYNATQPINFNYKHKKRVIESVKNCSFDAIYEVESNGTHSFQFSIEKPKTAIVSFRCEKIEGPSYILPREKDRPVSFALYKESVNGKGRPRFPP